MTIQMCVCLLQVGINVNGSSPRVNTFMKMWKTFTILLSCLKCLIYIRPGIYNMKCLNAEPSSKIENSCNPLFAFVLFIVSTTCPYYHWKACAFSAILCFIHDYSHAFYRKEQHKSVQIHVTQLLAYVERYIRMLI